MALNPPPLNVPDVKDPAVKNYLLQLKNAVYLLWNSLGAGTGILGITGGGTGSDTAAGSRAALGLEIGTDVQGFDDGLQSIAGLTTVADRSIYTTGADSYATYTITAFGRTLVSSATAALARTSLGLAIGSNVQAFDAGLQSIAGLTTAADKGIYTTGSDVYATFTLTAFGRTLVDDANAAAARSTLGLGSIATQAANSVAITGGTVAGLTAFGLDKTITAGGTTGARTINKPIGSVNFAAAATSLVVTNSLVDANSVVLATVATNDSTLKSVLAVAGSGSFTLYANAAATAETRVNFLVMN